MKRPNAERIFFIKYAIEAGFSIDEIFKLTFIDRWFLQNIQEIIDLEHEILKFKGMNIPNKLLKEAKQMGFSDVHLGKLLGLDEISVYNMRQDRKLKPVYKLVDTCSAEFEAFTPYYYSTYETEDESRA